MSIVVWSGVLRGRWDSYMPLPSVIRPLPLQEVYKYLKHKSSDFLQSEQAQEQVLILPMYPELSEEQIELVVKSVRDS